MTFHTGGYFKKAGVDTFYPTVEVSTTFQVCLISILSTQSLMADHVQLCRPQSALSHPSSSQSILLHNLPRKLEYEI